MGYWLLEVSGRPRPEHAHGGAAYRHRRGGRGKTPAEQQRGHGPRVVSITREPAAAGGPPPPPPCACASKTGSPPTSPSCPPLTKDLLRSSRRNPPPPQQSLSAEAGVRPGSTGPAAPPPCASLREDLGYAARRGRALTVAQLRGGHQRAGGAERAGRAGGGPMGRRGEVEARAGKQLLVEVRLDEFGLSLVDHTPEEILYFSMSNALLSYDTNLRGSSRVSDAPHPSPVKPPHPVNPLALSTPHPVTPSTAPYAQMPSLRC